MKKIFLMGRSEAGKTSLTQALKGEELHYVKTHIPPQRTILLILLESTRNPSGSAWGLACFSFEADVVAIVQAADEPFNLFGDSSRCLSSGP